MGGAVTHGREVGQWGMGWWAPHWGRWRPRGHGLGPRGRGGGSGAGGGSASRWAAGAWGTPGRRGAMGQGPERSGDRTQPLSPGPGSPPRSGTRCCSTTGASTRSTTSWRWRSSASRSSSPSRQVQPRRSPAQHPRHFLLAPQPGSAWHHGTGTASLAPCPHPWHRVCIPGTASHALHSWRHIPIPCITSPSLHPWHYLAPDPQRCIPYISSTSRASHPWHCIPCIASMALPGTASLAVNPLRCIPGTAWHCSRGTASHTFQPRPWHCVLCVASLVLHLNRMRPHPWHCIHTPCTASHALHLASRASHPWRCPLAPFPPPPLSPPDPSLCPLAAPGPCPQPDVPRGARR